MTLGKCCNKGLGVAVDVVCARCAVAAAGPSRGTTEDDDDDEVVVVVEWTKAAPLNADVLESVGVFVDGAERSTRPRMAQAAADPLSRCLDAKGPEEEDDNADIVPRSARICHSGREVVLLPTLCVLDHLDDLLLELALCCWPMLREHHVLSIIESGKFLVHSPDVPLLSIHFHLFIHSVPEQGV